MIYDLIKNIGIYKGISSNLDTAIDYIMKTDLNELPLGKTVIDGDKVFINVQNAQTRELTDESYEIHKDYMDIQIDLEGTEVIATGLDCVEALGDYKPDFQAVRAEQSAACTMGSGRFIICMTGEAHAPGGYLHRPESIKKCVVKVAYPDLLKK